MYCNEIWGLCKRKQSFGQGDLMCTSIEDSEKERCWVQRSESFWNGNAMFQGLQRADLCGRF